MTEYFIFLQRVLGAGNHRIAAILKYFGNPKAVFEASKEQLIKSSLFTPKQLEKLEKSKITYAVKICEECKKTGITIIPFGDKEYPYCLSTIENPPLVLYVKGNMPDFDNVPAICIVGPRKATDFGRKAAYSIGYRLAKSGMTIVSGGAKGADTCAHAGALKANGKTVIVMACGINSGYLQENEKLRDVVSKTGCLLSEYPPNTPASKFTFPVRNRIMSALSLGTVVVEGGIKSGAIITANHANEQGRDVFVIPGSPSAPEYAGSNALLRDGAKPLLELSDIFNEYIVRFTDKIDINRAYEKRTEKINKKLSVETLSKEARIVYNHLEKHKFYPDEIINTGLSSDELLSALTELEFELLIKALPGGCYELTGK